MSHRWTTSLRSVLRFSSFSFLTAVALAQSFPSEQDRLAATGKLWATVEYFHPALSHSGVDWDNALIAALPAIRAAKTADEYRSALGSLLRALPAEQHGIPQRTWVHYSLEKTGYLFSDAEIPAQPFDMGGGVTVRVQLAEPVSPNKPQAPKASTSADPFPAVESRILAAYKLWGAVHYFFAYRDLMDADWDDEFPKFLNAFIDAKDAREYHLAVAQAVTKLDDSRSETSSPVLDGYFGLATVPLRLRLVDKKPLVSEILDDEAVKMGIQIGDIVTTVDGEPIVKRIDREAAYLPASTHQALAELVMQRILNGAPDSEAVLAIRHHDGGEAEVRLKRVPALPQGRSPIFKQLSGKTAYLDLTRLQPGEVDEVFQRLADKESLILDLRGGLALDARTLAAKLNRKADVAGAIVSGPLLLRPDLPNETHITYTNSFFSVESVPFSETAYGGKVVLLIDGRTIGEAERLGLFLEAAQKVPFVGEDSAGACGPLSHFELPGGIQISLSSADVRHGNTGKLQRVGLTPSVPAPTELSDIRSGRDPAIEKALEYLARE